MAKKKQTHYSGIGGQAVLEGVMMKNRDKYAVAVRKPNGEIDVEVKRIIDECYAKAKDIILQHEDVLHSCAKLLLEKEKINRQEFEALFDKQNPAPVEA